MSFRLEVAVPEMALNSLTYESPVNIPKGSRVIVRVKKSLHVGFVIGRSVREFSGKIKPIEGIIDNQSIVPPDLWDMALWAGRVCMCGTGEALKFILPKKIIDGEKLKAPLESARGNFHELNYFSPFDSERVNFFMQELEKPKRTLILFPQKQAAKNFFSQLPEHLKSQALLWPYVKSWGAWQEVYSGKFRIVIAAPAGIFSPLSPEKIIIEDEANSSYIFQRSLTISARSLAGRRALFLGSEFITSGRMPSLKTYLRSHPVQKIIPERKNLILVDIFHSRKEEFLGIDGKIPLTFSLIKHTLRELAQKHNVIWILNRKGESSEVYCENCGQSLRCSKCGGLMRSETEGSVLVCKICGSLANLPEQCGICGCKFFRGKRPGLDSLAKIISRYSNDFHVYSESSKISDMHGLILATQRGLDLCSKINPGLVAWLDLDLELWKPEHYTRYNVFSMLYNSYWKGRKINSFRKVLIQSRRTGMKTAEFLTSGWQRFLDDELKIREEYTLPPYGYVVEVECNDKNLREKIFNALVNAGVFAMDPGDDNLPIYANTISLDIIRKILEPYYSVRRDTVKITVRSD